MILVDSSVWIDHLRSRDDALASLLASRRVLMHPFVLGEVALGHLRQRVLVISGLGLLPTVTLAMNADAMRLIETEQLFGLGLGYIDVHILASTILTANATLWTRDKRLASVAERLGVAANVD